MKLRWYGHSCFMLEGDGARVLFDPYAPQSVPGCELPDNLKADIVLSSHRHADHCWDDGIRLSGREVKAEITRIPCWHDDVMGAKRGANLISIVEIENYRIAHFGDLGHLLDAETIKKIGKLDALMIPVGGYYTIDANEAYEVVKSLKPDITVPMHYRGDGFGYENIARVDEFAKLCTNVINVNKNEIELENIDIPCTVLMKKS